MPASIFSETELARWASFPEEIPGDDLIRAFTLTGADRNLVAIRRGQQTAWGSRFSFVHFATSASFRALKKTDSRSRRELEAWRVATAQATSEKVRLFSRLGRLVLDPDIPDEQLRRRSFEEVASRELFAAAVEETEQLLRPRDGSYLDFVENRYGPLRKFAPLVLRVLDFKSLKTDDPLIDAVEILRELNRKRRRAGSRGRGTRVRLRQVARPVVGIRRASQSPVLQALCSLPTP